MTDERRQRILEIAEELESQGLTATNSAVYARSLDHRGHVVAVMKERRAHQVAQQGRVAVVEAEEPEDDEEPEGETTETPARVLAEDLKQLESAYEGYHLALERLWDLEREGVWDEHISQRQTFLEKTLTKNLHEQERVRDELERAQVREAVRHAQQAHDTPIPEARALAEQFLQALATVAHLGEDLAEVFGGQTDRFFPFRSVDGHQQFEVEDGRTDVERLFTQFFEGHPHARDAFRLLTSTPPTMGQLRRALESCPRLQPFSPRAVESYLHAITPQPEGTSNGSR